MRGGELKEKENFQKQLTALGMSGGRVGGWCRTQGGDQNVSSQCVFMCLQPNTGILTWNLCSDKQEREHC